MFCEAVASPKNPTTLYGQIHVEEKSAGERLKFGKFCWWSNINTFRKHQANHCKIILDVAMDLRSIPFIIVVTAAWNIDCALPSTDREHACITSPDK